MQYEISYIMKYWKQERGMGAGHTDSKQYKKLCPLFYSYPLSIKKNWHNRCAGDATTAILKQFVGAIYVEGRFQIS